MNYRLNIVVKDGIPDIGEFGGELPEGSWQIGGHEDQYGVSIHVVRRLPNGRHVGEAQHHFSHKNYDDSKFEPLQPDREDEVRDYPSHTSLVRPPVGPAAPEDGIPRRAPNKHDQIDQFANGPVEVTPGVWRNYHNGPGWLSRKSADKEREIDLGFANAELAPRAPYHVDIPLPDGERYPDTECASCGRVIGSRDIPCAECPDTDTVGSIDDVRVAHQPPVTGDTKLNTLPGVDTLPGKNTLPG
jgi:hypothetical protein